MKEIPLTKGLVAKVDDDDFEALKNYRWCVNNGYAFSSKLGRMHRHLLSPQRSVMIDHINGDKLDNRRKNLRLCTNSQNQMNRFKVKGLSKFKGVVWQKTKSGGSWQARIVIDGKLTYLGSFSTDLEAAACYNEASVKHFGEFAQLNDLSLPPSDKLSSKRSPQLRRVGPSAYKGVSFDKSRGKWVAQLKVQGVYVLRKRCGSATEAAIEYDKVARSVFKNQALLNFS